MLSAVIRSALGYPASTVGTITGTPEVRPSRSSRTRERSSQCSNTRTGYGPNCLVLGKGPLNALTPAPDMDRTVSRRSEPSSSTALMGEQPNPWNYQNIGSCVGSCVTVLHLDQHSLLSFQLAESSWAQGGAWKQL